MGFVVFFGLKREGVESVADIALYLSVEDMRSTEIDMNLLKARKAKTRSVEECALKAIGGVRADETGDVPVHQVHSGDHLGESTPAGPGVLRVQGSSEGNVPTRDSISAAGELFDALEQQTASRPADRATGATAGSASHMQASGGSVVGIDSDVLEERIGDTNASDDGDYTAPGEKPDSSAGMPS